MKDPDPMVMKQLLMELRDINKDKRRTAVMKLGMLGGDQAIRTLMLIVQNEYEDLIMRSRAALMLGKLGDPRAVDPLIRALDAPGHQTPLNAAEALGKLGDPRAIEPLLMLAASGRDRTREAALRALERIGYDSDEKAAEAAEQSPDERDFAHPETEQS
ncbi:MAG: HEAT repeat domain-containing protein [Chloroflexota bacterium]